MQELLYHLSSLSRESIDWHDVKKYFCNAATILLQHVKIVTPHDEYVIRELEWYYHNPAIDHTDEYCHRGPRQSTFDNWYLHRYGKDPYAFLRSRRNGIDITFGDMTMSIHGGILLRSIQSLNGQQQVSGINKVKRELIRSLSASQLHDLATSFHSSLFNFESFCCVWIFPSSMKPIVLRYGISQILSLSSYNNRIMPVPAVHRQRTNFETRPIQTAERLLDRQR